MIAPTIMEIRPTSRSSCALPSPGAERSRCLIFGCSVLFAMTPLIAATAARSNDLIEQKEYIRTTIDGRTVRLQVIIVKRADAQGRLPVALVNHPRPLVSYQQIDLLPLQDDSLREARDMAYRGWLGVAVRRRGYGMSDGDGAEEQLLAEAGPPPRYLFSLMNKDADDVQAALTVIAQRPDADPTRVISMGYSAGGGASVALGARNLPGLAAIIDVAGGEPRDAPTYFDASVSVDFKDFGSRTHIPSLWVFAKNDPKHPPDQVEAMRTAFTAAGGANLKVVELEPLGDNGHEMMGLPPGRTKWLAEVDSFLREHGLPTWQPSDVDALLRRLHWKGSARNYLETYMSATTEKALARSKKTDFGIFQEGDKLEEARAAALQACEAKAPPCYIAMENFTWVGP